MVCNTPIVRLVTIVISILFIAISIFILWRAASGRINGIAFPRYFWVTGRDAKIVSLVMAALLLALSVFVLLSAILKWDC